MALALNNLKRVDMPLNKETKSNQMLEENQGGQEQKHVYNNQNGLVSLFNGISTFVGYLMPKPFSEKKSSGTV